MEDPPKLFGPLQYIVAAFSIIGGVLLFLFFQSRTDEGITAIHIGSSIFAAIVGTFVIVRTFRRGNSA